MYVTDDTGTRLVISLCPRCGSRWFPARTICSACAHDQLTEARTGRDGTAYASTVVRIAPASFTAPYVLSYIDIDGVRILAHTEADPDDPAPLAPGTPVTLTSGPIRRDGDADVVSYRVRITEESAR
jgi:uncharacterized OB-fold protein